MQMIRFLIPGSIHLVQHRQLWGWGVRSVESNIGMLIPTYVDAAQGLAYDPALMLMI